MKKRPSDDFLQMLIMTISINHVADVWKAEQRLFEPVVGLDLEQDSGFVSGLEGLSTDYLRQLDRRGPFLLFIVCLWSALTIDLEPCRPYAF